MKKKLVAAVLTAGVVVAGTAYALNANPRAHEITNFMPGHSHVEHGTLGAPQHSGGTDSSGCHNGSVPYHCH
ncbi:hypothetical protein [Pseudomonas sp.]|uniref:hypothetical protein n=1 Tax=Pseudomonas sp. TaxID=306 RepID=UPI0027321979|nr:hypothetical protein [Pseudomonas sp.]MDP2243604.1 hypothetical protein [Pseudomonas sp.]